MRQRRHAPGQLFWRGVIAGVSGVAMVTGIYPLLPQVGTAVATRGRTSLRVLGREWAVALGMSAVRPAGFLPLPGANGHGPRPVIVLHGYAMGRANFLPLAARLAKAGLGPVLGFEYWTLGKTASAARRLAAYVDRVRAQTGAAQVDLVGHSMGGVVARYYVTLGGGDKSVANLITIGSPHLGTDVSAVGLGRPAKELVKGSSLMQRLAVAPPPSTKVTVIWSTADALVPGAREARLPGVDEIVYDDLGHMSLLASRRVANDVIVRLKR